MVRRAAVIVGAPDHRNCDHLNGVKSDMDAMCGFLLSPHGGAWRSTEVHRLENPTRTYLLSFLRTLENQTDYLLFHFGGHGHHPTPLGQNPQLASTALCLHDNDELLVSDIPSRIPKQSLIIDACRNVTPLILEMSGQDFAALAEKRAALDNYRASCRALYDAAIERAEIGRTEMYSCSLREEAGDGLFTPLMVGASEAWAERNERNRIAQNVYTVRDAFDRAKADTTSRRPLQNPIREVTRRMTHFPFAVA